MQTTRADVASSLNIVIYLFNNLGLEFMDELMDTVVDTEQVHDSFRLWMTTEEHNHFPIGLLQV